ncbi:histidine phosphatase family protein [Paenibacillus arenilitoris]|uniref:Histidine phosphatase family protein n=1 Tax=Paenibacillus arenilitoris TaxID=2772299 RepID=A0A927H7K3_9BACL|nr:histidine phosphatase family protein [Paenibacillus arenilitoris]MBD2869674.1 histidine phosphatase family protein [Paenibacillus arenilitoris]
MIIGFVRHGRTDWNAEGKIQGQTDIPLNEEGIRQAHALAERLKGEERIWDAVASSDLSRAYRTAGIIAEGLGIPLLDGDARLRERYFGDAEGTKENERHERWGADWRSAAPGVESSAEMKARGLDALAEWVNGYPERNLLVVTHGSFLVGLLAELCPGLTDEHLHNLSYSVLERHGQEWRARVYNCVKHLDGLAGRREGSLLL